MSADLTNQKNAFDFFKAKWDKNEEFTKDELQNVTGWHKDSTFNTYWSKQFRTLLVQVGPNLYRVSEKFRLFATWPKFRTHVTQNRDVSVAYRSLSYDVVVVFDFFMPLANEAHLRVSLDALFYKDSIMRRLSKANLAKVKQRFPPEELEDDAAFLERVCAWISNKFAGYSINHVDGRFRADELKTFREAAEMMVTGLDRYLIDETTAIVRFIFPCGKPEMGKFQAAADFDEELDEDALRDANEEAAKIRWFFYILFVQSIVEVVSGEDAIWLLESGFKNTLHIWKIADS